LILPGGELEGGLIPSLQEGDPPALGLEYYGYESCQGEKEATLRYFDFIREILEGK